MNQEFKQLLLSIKSEYGITQEEMATQLGVNRSYLSSIASGKYPYTDQMKDKISRAFPIPHSTNVISYNKTKQDDIDNSMVPVIPQNLYKETEVNILDYVTNPEEDVQMAHPVQQFPKTTCYYQVQTKAMFPLFYQGDILALKVISKSAPIVNGEVYAIDSNELGIIVRLAYDRGDHIEMRSPKEVEERFEPFAIDKKDIYNIFRVVGLIRTNI